MSKEQEAIERLEYLEGVLGHTMIQAGEIIGEQGKSIKILERLNFLIIDLKSNKKVNEIVTEEGKFNLANDIKTVLNMLKEKDYIIARQKKQIDLIKEYVHQEVVHYTESISDYIDDSKEENRHIIGELKEEREHWKDIYKILQNKEKDELYMNWWKYGLYE